jgi:hypothetical protein
VINVASEQPATLGTCYGAPAFPTCARVKLSINLPPVSRKTPASRKKRKVPPCYDPVLTGAERGLEVTWQVIGRGVIGYGSSSELPRVTARHFRREHIEHVKYIMIHKDPYGTCVQPRTSSIHWLQLPILLSEKHYYILP